MKKLALVGLSVMALAGCSSITTSEVDWSADATAMKAATDVTLRSNLWLNKMPMIGDERNEETLHGALYLESSSYLPAELDVTQVVLRQGTETWSIYADDVELRTHSATAWEVAFKWQLEIDPEQPVDVAVELIKEEKTEWVVNNQVKLDVVY
ncbi:hypothetical protein [Vibrio maerlii]|uniref:hypothetical protein n=1 Tax=Vibrio maerlii TaxID=2231648 RepID=UPI000E3EE46F|nr:hypothetical protein [Vibrio maerlii]